MIDIVNELNEKNSENITKEKMWSRKCPKCNKELTYSNRGNLQNANKNKRVCIRCHNKNQKKIRFPEAWIKKCPICNNILKYKSEKSFLYSIRHNNKCKYCQDATRKDREIRRCIKCKNKFECCKKSKRKFCSLKCHYSSGLSKHIRKVRKCKFCEKNIYYLDWETKHHPKIFCSKKCNIAYQMMFGFFIKTNPEIKMENILRNIFPTIKYNYEVNGKYYDFFIPEKNLLIEVDGVYWHGKNIEDEHLDKIQKRVRKNDIIKNQMAKNMGYSLLRIWEDEITEEYVSKYILQS